MKTLTLKLEDALYAKVLALAKRRRTTQSAVIRDAIAACFRQKASHMGSALDLSKDLAGCVTGPSDLSTNKAHLRRFGR
ncbi:MAG TPA: CopG family transcriptional regulator [Nitrospiraceae bacterium]|nr:CopG family transcriptional regulator [Nitrospiraceae bacterium]